MEAPRELTPELTPEERARFCTAQLVLEGELPAHFDGPVIVYARNLFRPEAVELCASPGLFAYVGHAKVAFDGSRYQFESEYGHRLTPMVLGQGFVLHVLNDTAAPLPLRAVVVGTSLDVDSYPRSAGGIPLVGTALKLGRRLRAPSLATANLP